MCDFAQYYHVMNWRALPVRLAATLAAGLPPESRSLMLLHGQSLTAVQIMQAATLDGVNALCWRFDRLMGSKEKPPDSVLHALLGSPAQEDSGAVQSFATPAEFEAALKATEGGETHGN